MTTPRRTRTAAALTGLASVAMALSACGGQADAKPTGIQQSDIDRIAAAASHQASASASAGTPGPTSGSASPVDYTVPEAAKAHTKEGAKAFVEFYWKTLDDLDTAPKIGIIPQLATDACRSCNMLETHLSDLKSKGAHVVTRNPQKGQLTIRSDSQPDSVVVRYTYSDAGAAHVAGGKTLASFPPSRATVETRADWTHGEWRIGAIGKLGN